MKLSISSILRNIARQSNIIRHIPDEIRICAILREKEFINHCGQASVLLDPLYFGAGNSFHESMYYGTPTVTLPSNYLKSRIVKGAYNQMKLENLKRSAC